MVRHSVVTGKVPSISTTATGRRRAVAALLILSALVLSALALSAVAPGARAHADPDAPAVDAKAQCESPDVGGVFVTDVQDGVPRSVCQYIVEGFFYYDTFENGTYVGTSVYRDGKTVPTERPAIPEVLGPVSLPFSPFA